MQQTSKISNKGCIVVVVFISVGVILVVKIPTNSILVVKTPTNSMLLNSRISSGEDCKIFHSFNLQFLPLGSQFIPYDLLTHPLTGRQYVGIHSQCSVLVIKILCSFSKLKPAHYCFQRQCNIKHTVGNQHITTSIIKNQTYQKISC